MAFLRHTGCPFAEATARGLARAAAEYPDVQWVAVTHAPQEPTDGWCAAVGLDHGVHVVADPDRSLYATWGVGPTSLRHFAGPSSLRGVASLARQGIRNRHPHGSRWQGAGHCRRQRTASSASSASRPRRRPARPRRGSDRGAGNGPGAIGESGESSMRRHGTLTARRGRR